MTTENGADKYVPSKGTLCGTISEARYTARERREARRSKPQTWVVRKLMVPIVLGIMGYTAYVYAGRFAVRLMHGGRRADGIGLLVGWCPLFGWMVWAYIKAIITPPGNACDYVSKTPQPLFPRGQWEPPQFAPDDDGASLADIEAGRIGGPAYEAYSNANDNNNKNKNTGAGAVPEPPAAHVPGTSLPLPANGAANPVNGTANANGNAPAPAPVRKRHRTPRGRFPPTTAALLPPHRWCARCSIVKPYRAHHCRVCGTCILKFDHHCPWIGQCVGARNHKFFLNFSYATFALTTYTFASLLAFNVNVSGREAVGEGDVDPQEVVIIALAALFALFTLSLGAAHTRLVLLSQTTVESLAVQRLTEREGAGLREAGVRWWEVG
ncbi:zf-DHHC-domain-containing protein [Mycena galericulata]|nr:zf-DHHC-domain-containing protein [Mycena galericulata]